MEFPSDLNNTAQQQNIPLPSAMSLDLPLIPDVPAEQAGPTPFSQAAPYSISNGNAMPHIGNTYQIPTSEVRRISFSPALAEIFIFAGLLGVLGRYGIDNVREKLLPACLEAFSKCSLRTLSTRHCETTSNAIGHTMVLISRFCRLEDMLGQTVRTGKPKLGSQRSQTT